ncbi:MAG TPA: M56 family metallopeptidase [Frankiaceae bacterium]|nr:M56 family metallopeptidase [Frankiaceae bacterium]
MTVGLVLMGYAGVVGVGGGVLLARSGWTSKAPLLAIVTYLAAAWSVVIAVALAGLTLALHTSALSGGLSRVIGACVIRLREEYGTPGGATVAALGIIIAGAVIARTTLAAVLHARAAGRQALLHAETARLVGRQRPELGAVLLEHAQPAAYCVAGRQPTVIVTSGAVEALSAAQLDAVMAHERAHLRYHHHRLQALARVARQVLPFMPLLRDAESQVEKFIEMHADDAATSVHDPRRLAKALVVLATSSSPAPALAAGATDVIARVQRLQRPVEPLGRARRQVLRLAAAALAITPVLLAFTPAAVALALGRVPTA